jgi:CCR4-NOT transcriptional regulation complex NOT5 subunit
MPRLLPVLTLCLLSAGASAQSLYKCRVNGTLTYSGAPCPGTASTAVEVPEAPAPSPGSAGELQRQQVQAAALQQARVKREQADARTDQARARMAEARRQRCGKLRLQKKWADEAAATATDKARDKAAAKARRLQETLALECPF